MKRNNLLPDNYTDQQKIKNSIKALVCNFLDFDDRRLISDSKHIKILKTLRKRFVIHKGNGVVLLTQADYINTISAMFADVTKFKLINANIPDICLTQLTTLQNYLRTIHKRNEIDGTIYSEIKPQSSRPARAHGLPKTHKAFDSLPPFRPIIDTTGTAHEFVAEYLSKLLFPLTLNEFKLKDSFDAVNRIHNIPPHLFSDGYRFVSFDVTSRFTNIPLRKTVDVILKRIYTDKQIQTGLQKRTLKKLIIDSCTKTPFFFNGQLYQQIDGVSMGSPLGPTLADIIMTAFEDAIIKPLIDSGVLKFYSRFVDDTLVLAKPSDFPFILNKLNSFHPQLQFTIDSFTDDQDIHFLDIKITPNGTSVYRKSTHTGQYVHSSSFTPWYRKTAWLRALIHRAYKLCSNSEILSIKLSEIYKFAS